jgi:hypothetical protein
MDSDDTPSIEDCGDAAWVASQHEIVVKYLEKECIEHGGVSLEPRWFVSPYVAVWAVRSRANPDRVGWWAISGDLPTDYMSCGHEADVGDVLIAFAASWREAAKRMAAGEEPNGFTIGDPSRAQDLAPLLAKRAETLHEFGVVAKSPPEP